MSIKILTYKQLKERIPYSREWLRQLESRGEFPRRVPLGPNSVGWLESEINDWLQAKAEGRS
ncbi:MAG: AlpA family phage regulatory protein [Pseudomonadota bacterium]